MPSINDGLVSLIEESISFKLINALLKFDILSKEYSLITSLI